MRNRPEAHNRARRVLTEIDIRDDNDRPQTIHLGHDIARKHRIIRRKIQPILTAQRLIPQTHPKRDAQPIFPNRPRYSGPMAN